MADDLSLLRQWPEVAEKADVYIVAKHHARKLSEEQRSRIFHLIALNVYMSQQAAGWR